MNNTVSRGSSWTTLLQQFVPDHQRVGEQHVLRQLTPSLLAVRLLVAVCASTPAGRLFSLFRGNLIWITLHFRTLYCSWRLRQQVSDAPLLRLSDCCMKSHYSCRCSVIPVVGAHDALQCLTSCYVARCCHQLRHFNRLLDCLFECSLSPRHQLQMCDGTCCFETLSSKGARKP